MSRWIKKAGFFSFCWIAFHLSYGILVAEAAPPYSNSCNAQTTDLKDDCTALEAIYDATGGTSWKTRTNWKTTTSLKDWYGVTVTNDRVSHLTLNANNLRGTLTDLSNLTSLQRLSLQKNDLSGEIPDLSNVINLQELILNGNDLSGKIPAELGNLTSLRSLYLHENDLSGEIPAELESLTNLSALFLQENNLSGGIPAELGNLTNLSALFLHENDLSGEIPALSKLTSLRQLLLHNNALTGVIPSNLPTSLLLLSLSGNNLSGTLTALSNLINLEELYLNNNALTGVIPSNLPTSLIKLYLHENDLSGEIPAELGNLTNLRELRLDENNLSGEIPDLRNLTNLWYLYLHNNALTGMIPSNLPRGLLHLLLQGNDLSGEIPAELGNLTNLLFLYLHENNLSGEIPDLSGLASLRYLYLHNNALTGVNPSNLPRENLLRLYLHDNNLEGSDGVLALNFSEFLKIKELSLWGNTDPAETITLPEGVKMSVVEKIALGFLYNANGGLNWSNRAGWLTDSPLGEWYGVTVDDESGRVTALDLSGNGLENSVSNSLEALRSLTELNLSNNANLSGTLPVGLKNIPGLENLNIRCTGISTPVHSDFGIWLNGLDSYKAGCPSAELPPPPLPDVTVSFGSSSYGVAEGEKVAVRVTLSVDPERTVSIPLSVDPATTAGDGDYSLSSRSVRFASGEVSKDISLSAADDGVEDDGEVVILTFGPLPQNVSEGVPVSVTVTISDVPAVSNPVPPPPDSTRGEGGCAVSAGADHGGAAVALLAVITVLFPPPRRRSGFRT